MSDIDITGLKKSAVLIALYEHARVQGMGFLQAKSEPLTEAEALVLLEENPRFDYLHGRVMKVRLDGDSFSPRLYDRDNGPGAAAFAVDTIRNGGLIVDADGDIEHAAIVRQPEA